MRRESFTFGGRMPWSVGLLLTMVVVPSVLAAFGTRHAGPLFELLSLRAPEVLHGQVWRVVTHVLVDPSPLGLFVAGLCVYWFGSDLARDWGDAWFLRIVASLALGSGVLVTLLSLVDPSIRVHRYLGTVPLTGALVVAWGLTFPDRFVRLWFVFTIRGFWIAWGTVTLTVLYAVYRGWELELPELVTEIGVLGYLYRDTLTAPLRKLGAPRPRRRPAKKVSHLRVVEDLEDDDEPPSLPPELQAELDALLGRTKTKPSGDQNRPN